MSDQLKLRFGAISPTIKEQLIDQGFSFGRNIIYHFQKDVEALNRLRIRGYIPDSQINKINQKIFNKILKHIEENNPQLLADN